MLLYRIKGTRNSIETVVREPQPPETDRKCHQVSKQIQNGTKQRQKFETKMPLGVTFFISVQ